MKIEMYERSSREFAPLLCKISKLKGRQYIVWGRFRMRVQGILGRHIFEDRYEIHKASATIRSRNDITLINNIDEKDLDVLAAVHLILPEGFKGKCIEAVNGKRIFYDYRKKGDSPARHFSVLAFILIKNNEMISIYDVVDGVLLKITIGNIEGKLERITTKKV